ncbi:uncharacterized protein LOC141532384 [Cotesia typhae]|uniref:uncharacterized protein LOC141532384 n=1 Tax=Cotesia typhae TaxID=2053667 RepID=UPI003D690E63
MPRQFTVIVLAGVALILGANAAQANLPTACVELGGTCDQHRRCCGENLKCDLSITLGEYECKEKAKLGDPCREVIHCIDIVHSVCSKNKCVCRQSNVRVSDYACAPILNGYCWKNETCMTENSLCIDNECQCTDGFLAEDNKCLPVVIGSKCSDDAACASVQFAECSSNKVCVCSNNTIRINGRLCLVRLGETCHFDKDCAVANSWCVDNKCQCKAQYFVYSEVECRLVFVGMPCNYTTNCQIHIDNSYCFDRICQCKQNFLTRNGNVCEPVIISYCATNKDCLDLESTCINNRCQCNTNYVMRESKCLPKLLLGRCTEHSDCSEIKFTMCLNGQCHCIDKFFPVNATACKRGIGGSCSTDKDCTVEFSMCFEKTCRCNRGYIQYSESQCVSLELGTACINNSYCNLIKNSHCFDSQCICKDDHVELDAYTCAPLLNAICSDDLKCAPRNSVCVDHRCQCEYTYSPKSNFECVLSKSQPSVEIFF